MHQLSNTTTPPFSLFSVSQSMRNINSNTTECCMCGDPGFSDQLFQCKLCHFRSQHRYCSNIYPKIESSGTCNWCLSHQKEEKPSPTSSSPYRNNFSTDDDETKNKMRIRKGVMRGSSSALQLQPQKPIKKHKSPERTSSPSQSPQVLISTRKRIVTNGALEERLIRRTKSEDVTNRSSGGASKQVFRNKVRRYKLLDEVSRREFL